MDDFLRVLNDKQRQAVTAPLGPVLVLAGAGSGKTRVLTYRIAYLIKKQIFKSDEILALTFTNKAAGEMKQRIEILTRPPATLSPGERGWGEGLTMGTFHSVCARILRKEIHELGEGYSEHFTIYDSDDTLKTIKHITLELGLSENFRPQVFSYYISSAKNKLIEPEDLAEDDFFRESLRKVYLEYRRVLRENNALDFDDLLNFTYKLFHKVPKVREKYQKKFKYVLVDEYQDTNQVQYMLLALLTAKHKNLFVVGDDAQSIYGFRGANMQNILDFKKDFKRAKIVMLEQNYRSTQNILDAAGKVIGLNPMQYEKKLWTDNHSGEKIMLYEAVDETDESEFVVRRIMNHNAPLTPSYLKRGEGELQYVSEEVTPLLDSFMKRRFGSYPPSIIHNSKFLIPQNLKDFVILYRTHAQSRPLEEALLHAGIPYQIIGGIKFYERREIKDVAAYLRLVTNPRDLVSLSRIINTPARGLGPKNFKEIIKGLITYDYNFTRMFLNVEKLNLQSKAREGARNFFDLFARIEELDKQKNILEVMDLLIARSGYKDYLLDGSKEGQERWENVEQLFNVGGKYKILEWKEGLARFLEETALMSDLDSLDEQTNRLTLMTLHSAKGLEFDQVFFVGLEEGLLPHSRSMNSPQEIAEEIRLAYVGMTRAKKSLFLSFAHMRQVYGELRRSVPSRIIKAIPEKLINKISNF